MLLVTLYFLYRDVVLAILIGAVCVACCTLLYAYYLAIEV